jgi:hypothetical protein
LELLLIIEVKANGQREQVRHHMEAEIAYGHNIYSHSDDMYTIEDRNIRREQLDDNNTVGFNVVVAGLPEQKHRRNIREVNNLELVFHFQHVGTPKLEVFW